MMWERIRDFVLGGSIVGGIVTYLFKNPQQVELWLAYFWKTLGSIRCITLFAQKQQAKYDIEANVNNLIAKAQKFIPELKEYTVKVFLASRENKGNYVDNNKVYICLKTRRGDENLADAVCYYIANTFFLEARNYLHGDQREALLLFVTAQILLRSSFDLHARFLEHRVKKACQKVKDYYEAFVDIEKHGYFYSILLRELYFLGVKLRGHAESRVGATEALELQDRIHQLALRPIGKSIPLDVRGKYIRASTLIIGKAGKVLGVSSSSPNNPYVNRINQFLRDKVENVYLLVPAPHSFIIKDIVNAVSSNFEKCIEVRTKLLLINQNEFFEQKTYIIILRNRKAPAAFSKAEIRIIETDNFADDEASC